MPSPNSPVASALCEPRLLFTQRAFCEGSEPFTSRFQLSTVNSRLFRSNSFRITYICKNAPANPYGSHISKTNDLKPFRFTHFQKSGRGRAPLSNLQPHTSNLCSSLTPLDSA